MGSFFGAIVSWLLGRLFGKPAPPSQLQVQTERAAVAETKVAEAAQDAKTSAAIAQAVTDAPKTVEGVQAKLRKGEF